MSKTPAIANRSLGVLKSMLNRARDWGLIDGDNPTSRVRLYPERLREVMLSQKQLVALAQAIAEEEAFGGVSAKPRGQPPAVEDENPPPKPTRGGKGLKELHSRGITPWAASLFRLLIFTGARLREIMDARWSWVDWDRNALRLPDSKTGKKAVWLNPMALEELRRLVTIRRQEEWIIEGRVRGARMVNPQKPWKRVRERAAKLLEGEDSKVMERLRIHDLRHSFASIAVASGIPLALVGKTLGHAKAKTTERYAHIADDPTRAAARKTGQQIKKLIDGTKGGKRRPR
jgi:integrase